MKNKKNLIALVIGLILGVILGCYLTYLVFCSLNITEAAKSLLGIIGGGAGVIAALAYFCRTYAEHKFGILSERHRIVFAKSVFEKCRKISR